MKTYITILTIVCCNFAFANEHNFHIEEKQFDEFLYSDEVCEIDSNRVVIEHEIQLRYPHFHYSNHISDSILNHVIDLLVVDFHPYSDENIINLDDIQKFDTTLNQCDNIPYSTTLDYKINLIDNSLISTEFLFLDVACCGGNGSRGETRYFTFDLGSQSELYLDDITLEHTAMLDSINTQLVRKFKQYHIDSSETFKIYDLDMPFGIKDKEILLAVNSPTGYGSFNLVFYLSFPFEEIKPIINLKMD